MSKLQELGLTGPFTANADGSVNGTFSKYECQYHIHETATPDVWQALQSDIADGLVTVVAYVDPIPDLAAIEEERITALKFAAKLAIRQSDITIIRCAEFSVAIPEEWKDYRTALRAIMAGTDTTTLPTKPAYPAGT
jgi:hypothetical protein